MNPSFHFPRPVFFILVFLLGISTAGESYSQSTNSRPASQAMAVGAFVDQQSGAFNPNDAICLFFRTGDLEIRPKPECICIHFTDFQMFKDFSQIATLSSSFFPIQVIYHGPDERSSRTEYSCLLSYCLDRKGVLSANSATTAFLKQETLGANVNFWKPLKTASFLDQDDVQTIVSSNLVVPVVEESVIDHPDGFPEGIDCNGKTMEELVLVLDKNFADLSDPQKDCVRAYHFFTKDLIKHSKCLKVDRPTANEKKCAIVWRRCIRRMCPDVFGMPVPPPPDENTGDEDDLEEQCECFKDENNDGVNDCPIVDPGVNPHVGHLPDNCIGGHPAPNGCFLPMDPVCNCTLGRSCGKVLDDMDDNDKDCIFYNKIVIKTKDGTVLRCDDLTQGQKDTIVAQKQANETKFCNWINDPANANCKTVLEACINSLPEAQRFPLPVKQVIE